MRYLTIVASSFMLALVAYIGIIPVLGPTPVAAEYWVRELIVIKRSIAQRYAHQEKIIIASGSSALFSIDTQLLNQQLGIPVLNFGLMGGMPLDLVLKEASDSASTNDTIILALEPDYYCREQHKGFDEWVLRNAIAWDHAYWNTLSLSARLMAIRALGFRFPLEILKTRFDLAFNQSSLNPRLFALNNEQVLKKYANPPPIADNLYSVYNLDRLGNIKNTNDHAYDGAPRRADMLVPVCTKTFTLLKSFVTEQKNRGVRVYFANTPFVNLPDLDMSALSKASKAFADTVNSIAPLLDDRTDVLFDRKFFLNSELHLNAMGRAVRTERLLTAIKDNVR
jgi:hypothetical protein